MPTLGRKLQGFQVKILLSSKRIRENSMLGKIFSVLERIKPKVITRFLYDSNMYVSLYACIIKIDSLSSFLLLAKCFFPESEFTLNVRWLRRIDYVLNGPYSISDSDGLEIFFHTLSSLL